MRLVKFMCQVVEGSGSARQIFVVYSTEWHYNCNRYPWRLPPGVLVPSFDIIEILITDFQNLFSNDGPSDFRVYTKFCNSKRIAFRLSLLIDCTGF